MTFCQCGDVNDEEVLDFHGSINDPEDCVVKWCNLCCKPERPTLDWSCLNVEDAWFLSHSNVSLESFSLYKDFSFVPNYEWTVILTYAHYVYNRSGLNCFVFRSIRNRQRYWLFGMDNWSYCKLNWSIVKYKLKTPMHPQPAHPRTSFSASHFLSL